MSRTWKSALTLALLVLSICAWAQPDAIYYLANHQSTIMRAALDGSNQTVLLAAPPFGNSIAGVAVDPAGEQIAYVASSDGWSDQLWAMNADGSNNHKVCNMSWTQGNLRWFADGKHVAIKRGIYGTGNIMKVNMADGTSTVWISSQYFNQYGLNDYRGNFTWDSSRTRAVLSIGTGGAGRSTAFSASLDYETGTLTNITRLSAWGTWDYSYYSCSNEITADGKETYYSWRDGHGNVDIIRCNFDGSQQVTVRHMQNSEAAFVKFRPGTEELYVFTQTNGGDNSIGVMNPDGSAYRALINTYGAYSTFDFGYLPKGSIAGTVTTDSTGLEGVTLILSQKVNDEVKLISSTVTAADGGYLFPGLAPGSYTVSLVEPLGYSAAVNTQDVTVQALKTAVADFALVQVVTLNACRDRAYWQHQFDEAVKGKEKSQDESPEALLSYIDKIQTHFGTRFHLFEGMTTLTSWQNVLRIGGKGKREDATAQMAAFLMNLASLKVGQYTHITADNRTAGDVLTWSATILANAAATEKHLENVRKALEEANKAGKIKAGVVPAGNVLYKGMGDPLAESAASRASAPTAYALHANYPNPFNPTTTITFDLLHAGYTSLRVYDNLGREVAVLVDEVMPEGNHAVVFNAGKLSSGTYFYRLQAGSYIETRRLVLTK